MKGLIIFVAAVLVLQIVFFFIIRKKRKQERENSVLEKYNIRSSGDAFRLLQDPEVPEKDKKEIERLYRGNENN